MCCVPPQWRIPQDLPDPVRVLALSGNRLGLPLALERRREPPGCPAQTLPSSCNRAAVQNVVRVCFDRCSPASCRGKFSGPCKLLFSFKSKQGKRKSKCGPVGCWQKAGCSVLHYGERRTRTPQSEASFGATAELPLSDRGLLRRGQPGRESQPVGKALPEERTW